MIKLLRLKKKKKDIYIYILYENIQNNYIKITILINLDWFWIVLLNFYTNVTSSIKLVIMNSFN